MTALLDRKASESFGWLAHAHIDKFSAKDERDAAFALFPEQAKAAEKAGLIRVGDRGGLERVPDVMSIVPPELVVPHITSDMLLAVGADVIGTVDETGNLLVNAGINKMGGWLIVDSGTHYNAANTAIGVGDTSTAAAASQTDLSAAVNSANRWVQLVDSIPTFATQVLTCVATFATGNGNFVWNEWAIGQNTSSAAAAITASMLNRKVASLGTKTSAVAWAFTVTITIS